MSFFCEECEYTTNKKYNLIRHQNNKHFKKELKIQNEEKHIQNEEIVNQNEEIVNQNEEIVNQNEEIVNQNEEIVKQQIYQCKKCNKNYKTKKYLIEHEKICNGINILTCPKCMFTFSSRSSKSAHIKKNNCKAKSIIHLVNKETDNENKPNLYININNNNNIINNTIINNFGNERTDYITLDDMIQIFKCGDNIIPKYIELKHFNKEFPENHNIKYEKNKGCLIKNDNKWGLTNLEILSNKLFDKNSYELRNYYNNQKTDIEEKIMNIEVLEFIYSRLNYLDLNLNRTLFNNIKNEIKNIIKYNMLF
jgi:hypothetical protein